MNRLTDILVTTGKQIDWDLPRTPTPDETVPETMSEKARAAIRPTLFSSAGWNSLCADLKLCFYSSTRFLSPESGAGKLNP